MIRIMDINVEKEIVAKYRPEQVVDWAVKTLASSRREMDEDGTNAYVLGLAVADVFQVERVLRALHQKMSNQGQIKQA